MNAFKKLFGIEQGEIRENCIICPMPGNVGLFSGAGSVQSARGLLFSVINAGYASVIHSKYGTMAGDCVLLLNDTACRNIFLFGSCGSTGVIDLGTKVMTKKALVLESFTEMLKFREGMDASYPDKKLFEKFEGFAAGKNIMQLNCATVGSLFLEAGYIQWFAKHKISCVDMESSLVFSSALHIKRRAISLSYVTDIITKKPFYTDLEPAERQKIDNSKNELAKLLILFIQSPQNAKS
ncbi:MAG: hypothetical protein ABII64_08830 [Elusimicrobiota bacterium]